jgi:hypothetical protein
MSASDPDTVTLRFTINGTTANPYARWGLDHNPFPQTGIHELRGGEAQLASLGGRPIRDAADIRERLAGFDPAFIERVVGAWVPGEMVGITVTFPRARPERM